LNEEYISYKCNQCTLVFIMPLDGLRRAKVMNKVIRCPICHGGIKELDRYDDMLKCMNQKYSSLT